MGAHDPARAAELAELALVEAGDDAAARAVALETAAILDMNLGRAARAAERAEAALALYRALGDGAGVARILDGRAMAAFLDGRITEAVGLFGRVAGLFEDSGDLLRVVTPRSTRGHALVFHAEPEEGLAETSAALQLARDLGTPEGQAYALWHRSEALSALGPGRRGRGRRAGGAGRRPCGRPPRLDRDRPGGRSASRCRRRSGSTRPARRSAESAQAAGETLTLFASWAAARCALVAVALGRLDDAARVGATGRWPPGRRWGTTRRGWAQVELAAARGTDDCAVAGRGRVAPGRGGRAPGLGAAARGCWRAGPDGAAGSGIGTDPRRRGQPRAGADQRLPALHRLNRGFRSPERPNRLRMVISVSDDPTGLWTCPGCGRTFANRNQTHTCAPLGSVDDALRRLRAGGPGDLRRRSRRRPRVRTRRRPPGAHPHRPARAHELRRITAPAPLARRAPRARAPDRQPPLPAGRGLLPAQRPARVPLRRLRARWTPQFAAYLAEAYRVGAQEHLRGGQGR